MLSRSLAVLALLLVGCSSSDAASPAAGPPPGGSPDAAASTPDASSACASPLPAAPGLVLTDRGPVQGVAANGTWGFEGIPYAAPPVGDLRWKPPAAHACWASPLDASKFGKMCLQLSATDTTAVVGDEDCLTLNVWAPEGATATSHLPVLFFIHGGGNVQGSSSEESVGTHLYQGDLLAAHTNAVVVTANYRLGPLGWLAHPAFAAESAHGSAGNYGTLDQIAALRWVQTNIAAFGGDPAHVLAFGESAGAVNVCALVVSPLAKGLFSSALMESGGCTAIAAATTAKFAASYAAAASCDTAPDVAACLRALPGDRIIQTLSEPASIAGAGQGDYQPSVDGWVFPDTPVRILQAGTHNHVPFVIGGNSDETARAVPPALTEAAYEAAVLTYSGGLKTLADKVLAMYPASDYASPSKALAAITTDAKFICTVRYDARLAAAAQPGTPVYRYLYTHALDNGQPTLKAFGAWHGIELPFVFRQSSIAGYTASPGELALSDAIDASWLALAATGNPSSAGTTWPPYDTATDPYVQLDDTVKTAAGVRTKYCDFWDQTLLR